MMSSSVLLFEPEATSSAYAAFCTVGRIGKRPITKTVDKKICTNFNGTVFNVFSLYVACNLLLPTKQMLLAYVI